MRHRLLPALLGLLLVASDRGRRHAIVFLALGVALAAHAHAATIDASNAQDLQHLVVYSNATVTISANETGIVISNQDNATALVVLNPLFGYVLRNVSGATPVIVNATDNTVLGVIANTTSVDIVVFPREAGGAALGLVIQPLSSAVIGSVFFEAPGSEGGATAAAEGLNAVAPPPGYQLAYDKSDVHDFNYQWTMPAKGTLWVAFNPGKVNRGWYTGKLASVSIYSYADRQLWYMCLADGSPGQYLVKRFPVSAGKIEFNVVSQLDHDSTVTLDKVQMAWRLVWAYKAESGGSGEPPDNGNNGDNAGDVKPAPISDTNTARYDTPAYRETNIIKDDKTKYAIAGVVAVIVFLALAYVATRR